MKVCRDNKLVYGELKVGEARATQSLPLETLIRLCFFDLNLELTKEIEKTCEVHGIEVIGKIPFDEAVVEVIMQSSYLKSLFVLRNLGRSYIRIFSESK